MRFVNQLESGTSSIVLTLTARTGDRSPGDPNVFSRKSSVSASSSSRAPLASKAASLSTAIGSSG
jgi:hypothetical protein